MKVKELKEKSEQLKQDFGRGDVCELCATHEVAEKLLSNGFYCPHCGKYIGELHFNEYDWRAVGEYNGIPDDEQEIGKFPIFMCQNCYKYSAAVLRPIIYNGNHDVFYTGGKKYLINFDENKFVKRIKPSIQEYLNRYEKDSYLTSSNLALWIVRDLEHYVAEIMKENELKW